MYAHPMYSKEASAYEYMAGRCYDHIWLAALALNCTNRRMKEIGEKLKGAINCLHSFQVILVLKSVCIDETRTVNLLMQVLFLT